MKTSLRIDMMDQEEKYPLNTPPSGAAATAATCSTVSCTNWVANCTNQAWIFWMANGTPVLIENEDKANYSFDSKISVGACLAHSTHWFTFFGVNPVLVLSVLPWQLNFPIRTAQMFGSWSSVEQCNRRLKNVSCCLGVSVP